MDPGLACAGEEEEAGKDNAIKKKKALRAVPLEGSPLMRVESTLQAGGSAKLDLASLNGNLL